MFGITTAADFHAKAGADLAALEERISDASLAMNAILSFYHLHEWVWARGLKLKAPLSIRGSSIRNSRDWTAFLDEHQPHFALLQSLANGSKHCSPVHATDRVAGYGRGPYGVGPFGAAYLLIDKGEELASDRRWATAHGVLREVAAFWTDLLVEIEIVGAPT